MYYLSNLKKLKWPCESLGLVALLLSDQIQNICTKINIAKITFNQNEVKLAHNLKKKYHDTQLENWS